MKSRKEVLRWLRRRRTAVLLGGLSSEREISLRTGKAVLQAFRDLGLDAAGVDADRSTAEQLRRARAGFCFIALHGKWGEDGTVQGLCEMLGLPYSGSGVLASALSMDKEAAKRIFASHGIPTAPFQILERGQALRIPLPAAVKPVDGGSAIGVSIVHKPSGLAKALRKAFRYSRRVLAEKFIAGREVTVPVLGEKVLPVIEIVPKRAFYDFKAKYEPGMSDHLLPARVAEKTRRRLGELALAAHRALGCRAFSRVDFILDRSERPWVLELNSIPGMTETSLFPEAARAAGYAFPEMILEMVRLSLD